MGYGNGWICVVMRGYCEMGWDDVVGYGMVVRDMGYGMVLRDMGWCYGIWDDGTGYGMVLRDMG